jgi:hypothetical protein
MNILKPRYAATAEMTALLGIDKDACEYLVAFAEVARNSKELAILTRSTLNMVLELVGQIRVPPAHVEEGRTVSSRFDVDDQVQSNAPGLIDVRRGVERPVDASVAVRKGHMHQSTINFRKKLRTTTMSFDCFTGRCGWQGEPALV